MAQIPPEIIVEIAVNCDVPTIVKLAQTCSKMRDCALAALRRKMPQISGEFRDFYVAIIRDEVLTKCKSIVTPTPYQPSMQLFGIDFVVMKDFENKLKTLRRSTKMSYLNNGESTVLLDKITEDFSENMSLIINVNDGIAAKLHIVADCVFDSFFTS